MMQSTLIAEPMVATTLPATRRHPARYSDALLPVMARYLIGCRRVLDPFGGVGGVFRLSAWLPGAELQAVEIEPEWAAADPRITLGSALSLPWAAGYFDAVATSPAYGNRMADHHDARDGSRRSSSPMPVVASTRTVARNPPRWPLFSRSLASRPPGERTP